MAKRETMEELRIRLSESFDIRGELQEENSKLIKQLEAERNNIGVVSKADYDTVLKDFKEMEQRYKMYYDLYQKELAKNDHATYQNKINTLSKRIEELESMVSDKPKTGRKRKNDISSVEIIAMSQDGKSLRTISKETELSVNTIRDILKGVSK